MKVKSKYLCKSMAIALIAASASSTSIAPTVAQSVNDCTCSSAIGSPAIVNGVNGSVFVDGAAVENGSNLLAGSDLMVGTGSSAVLSLNSGCSVSVGSDKVATLTLDNAGTKQCIKTSSLSESFSTQAPAIPPIFIIGAIAGATIGIIEATDDDDNPASTSP